MTTRTLLLTTVLMAAVPIAAQTPAPRSATPTAPAAPAVPRSPTAELAIPPPPPPAPPVAASQRAGQPVNVKVEFTLTDQRGSASPVKRTVSVIVADQHTGQIRSNSDLFDVATGRVLNVDTTPELLTDGKLRVGFSLQYSWLTASSERLEHGAVTKTLTNDSASLILENGKAMVATQSSDPIEERQLTVEVKATILK